jgi:hypothetical protein
MREERSGTGAPLSSSLPDRWNAIFRTLAGRCRLTSGRLSPPITSAISTNISTARQERSEQVFADTLYWGASLHPHDQYRAQAIRAQAAMGPVILVTTDEVLAELLDGLAQRGRNLRDAGALSGSQNTVRCAGERSSTVAHIIPRGTTSIRAAHRQGLQPC